MKTLVLGLGNPILTDDGVGIHVVREVSERVRERVPSLTSDGDRDDITCAEASIGGLRLLDLLAGFDRAILVDAIQTREGQPGEIYRLRLDDVRASMHSGSTHDLTLAGALALGRGLGMHLPADEHIAILAIEAQDVLTFGERCTPEVEATIPRAVARLLDELWGA